MYFPWENDVRCSNLEPMTIMAGKERIVMFKLTGKLALSNLKQNHALYYPFALSIILLTMILYSFIALSSTPHLGFLRRGGLRTLFLVFGPVSSSSSRHHFGRRLCQWLYHEKSFQRTGLCTVFWEWRRNISHHDLMGNCSSSMFSQLE